MQPRITRNGKDTVYRGFQDEKWFQDVIDKVYIWKKKQTNFKVPMFPSGGCDQVATLKSNKCK